MRWVAVLLSFLPASSQPPAPLVQPSSPPQFDQSFPTSLESDSERVGPGETWPAALYTACDAPGSGPSICLTGTAPSYRRGEAISAHLSWRNVPTGASVVVYLERDDRRAGQRYIGPVGPLLLNSMPIERSGSSRFDWNGHDFPCAPTDFPMLCRETAEIGRYRLRAVLFPRRDILTVRGLSPAPTAPCSCGRSTPAPLWPAT